MASEVCMPIWYPLSLDKARKQVVRDGRGYEFASAQSVEAASLIVLTLNDAARRDFGLAA